ncbi:MAG: methyltransferase domain-containing protein [SAR324 cluster bacterium]|nr:methyltransferase domain-containing protein [SAR324 cluster bacterium]
MEIVFYVPGMPFNGETLARGLSLGGSESAGYYLARELAARGHRVSVFSTIPPQGAGSWDGVTYLPIGAATEEAPCGEGFEAWAASTPHDALIGQRLPALFHRRYAAKVTLWWTHDLALKRNLPALSRQLWNLNGVLCVSAFHKAQVAEVYGLPPERIAVAPNGVDPALFSGGGEASIKRRGKILFYSSRPERGLENLLGLNGSTGIMERLHQADPEIVLQVCGYENTTPELAGYYAALLERCAALPNVTWLGALSKGELAARMEAAWLHVYPTTFEEVSCITVMEAQCAGTPVVASPVAALPETLRDGGVHWVPLAAPKTPDGENAPSSAVLQTPGFQSTVSQTTVPGRVDREAFAQAVLALREDPERYDRLRGIALEKGAGFRWAQAADAVEAAIGEAMARQSGAPGRLARHLMRMSDIGALRAHLKGLDAGGTSGKAAPEPDGPPSLSSGVTPDGSSGGSSGGSYDLALAEDVREELGECYRFAEPEADGAGGKETMEATAGARLADHYTAYYEYEQKRGVVYGPEALAGNPRFEAVARRLEGLEAGGVVLDYGCAHGHYTINLARRFPHLRFIGIDLVSSNLDAARRWAGEEKLDNVAFRLGTLDAHLETLPPLTRVIAAEVLEHVPHPATLADRLAGLLTPAGRMILTTPYGPWEAQGYAAHHPWRAHLHHLERADLEDMFAAHPGFSIEAVPAGQSPWGEALGSWITEYGKPASPNRRSGSMDLERKLRTQAPRETLSVCMIVKPDGDTLARTLKSVSAIADEVIIGIDDGRAGNPGGAADRADGAADRSSGAVNRAGGAAGRAWQIAEDCGARAFSIASPLSVGFDTVRNTTIERASGDWILWIDDDEELLWPERLPKYLRDNSYDAYAVKQHHYSVEPGGVLKTDFPCRLFRNRNGIRFYGAVHEHPERGLNQGAGRVLLLPDVAICHNGYVTEAVRRERFQRNLPLMRRDREANAERLLGRFLWIRDLAHLNRFDFERGGTVSDEMRARAEEAVALWRGLVAEGQARMAVDSLPYYSEATDLLTGGGIDYALQLGIHHHGLGDPAGQAGTTLQGRFMDTGDIRRLTEALLNEKTALVEGRYV